MKDPPTECFKTSDLALASFIKVKGHDLERLEPSQEDPARIELIFALPEAKGEAIAKDFLNRRASADARSLCEELGFLKRLVLKFQRQNGNGRSHKQHRAGGYVANSG